jgi:hypothetical protein
MSMLLALLLTCLAFFGRGESDSPCSAHAFFPERLTNYVLPRFAQNLILFLCRIHREIMSGQMHDPKQRDVKYQHIHPAT